MILFVHLANVIKYSPWASDSARKAEMNTRIRLLIESMQSGREDRPVIQSLQYNSMSMRNIEIQAREAVVINYLRRSGKRASEKSWC